MEVIAPKVGGVEAADGSWIEAKHMVDGGPSVLFDTVVLLLSEEGAERLTGEAAARDFVADAFAHCKFIGFTAEAMPLTAKGRRRSRSGRWPDLARWTEVGCRIYRILPQAATVGARIQCQALVPSRQSRPD